MKVPMTGNPSIDKRIVYVAVRSQAAIEAAGAWLETIGDRGQRIKGSFRRQQRRFYGLTERIRRRPRFQRGPLDASPPTPRKNRVT